MATYLNPNAIKDGSISVSKIDETVASKSYVDELVGDINSVLESIING